MKAAAALCAALLAGCALLQPDAWEALQVRDIVGAADSGARATPGEQRRQLAHAEQMFKAVPDDANRVRLAALLATLPVPLRDEARAGALLEPLAARRPETPLAQLAGVLAAGAAERQRLVRELHAAERGEVLQVRDIVGAAVSGARATPDEQRRQLAHAEQMFKAVPDDANRVRLAALLATLPLPVRDEARAGALLEPLAARRPETPLAQLAGMLAAGTAERQRLTRELRAAERREVAADERATTLSQQLEALKSIERGILEREERRRTITR